MAKRHSTRSRRGKNTRSSAIQSPSQQNPNLKEATESGKIEASENYQKTPQVYGDDNGGYSHSDKMEIGHGINEDENAEDEEGADFEPKLDPGNHDFNLLAKRYHFKVVNYRLHTERKSISKESAPEEAEKSTIDTRKAAMRAKGYYRSLEMGEKADAIFKDWAKQELLGKLHESKQLFALPDSGNSLERDIVLMRKWVRKALRRQFKVFVQRCHSGAAVENPGIGGRSKRRKSGKDKAKSRQAEGDVSVDDKCQHPACGISFEKGTYRVSFEPSAWTKPVRFPRAGDGVEGQTEESNSQPLPGLPDYTALVAEQLRRGNEECTKYDIGSFFCVSCFEDLLKREVAVSVDCSTHESQEHRAPSGTSLLTESQAIQASRSVSTKRQQKLSSKKRKDPSGELASEKQAPELMRPNPITRIYSVIFPETRYSSIGRLQLDEYATEMVEGWKIAQCERGKWLMMGKYDFLAELDSDSDFNESNLEQDEEMERIPDVAREEGIGLAECLRNLTTIESKKPSKIEGLSSISN
jgi:hypothetical protein